tara:strand:+ start:2487 stop:4031 length:1545 start_codon:yes stop_codon:yes gene_type:complete
MTVSYAQQFEDVILWRALKDVQNGAYIDIGANDPVVDSVSLLFYEKGWRGMHVEPMPGYAQKLREARADEQVLEAAVGEASDEIELFSFEGTGLTTAIPGFAKQHEKAGRELTKIKVECVPLAEIFELFNRLHIHWLKIDVEGMEKGVVQSWGSHPARPWVVVIESTRPNSQEPAFEDWEPELTKRGYGFAYFDGLNRFYVHEDHAELATAINLPPNFFDFFSLSEHSPFSWHLTGRLNAAEEEIAKLLARLEQLLAEREAHDVHTKWVESELAKVQSSIADRDMAIKWLQDQLAEVRIEVEARDGTVEWLQSQLTESKAETEARERAIEQLQKQLADAESLQQKISAAEREVASLGATNADLIVQVSQWEQRAAGLQREMDLWRQQANALRLQSDEIRNSASWKLSAPIRWGGHLARLAIQGTKSTLRPAAAGGLNIVRAIPWIKSPMLAAASLVPPLRRKIDHFSLVRQQAQEALQTPPAAAAGINAPARADASDVKLYPRAAQILHDLGAT